MVRDVGLGGLRSGDGGDAYAAPDYDRGCVLVLPSRTQLRNAQRKHTKKSLQLAMVIAMERIAVHETCLRMVAEDAGTVLQSIAAHRTDCNNMGMNVHYAAVANEQSRRQGYKTEQTYRQHKKLHKLANLVKHMHRQGDNDVVEHTTLPPMPTVNVHFCSDVEKKLRVPSTHKFNKDAPCFVPAARRLDKYSNHATATAILQTHDIHNKLQGDTLAKDIDDSPEVSSILGTDRIHMQRIDLVTDGAEQDLIDQAHLSADTVSVIVAAGERDSSDFRHTGTSRCIHIDTAHWEELLQPTLCELMRSIMGHYTDDSAAQFDLYGGRDSAKHEQECQDAKSCLLKVLNQGPSHESPTCELCSNKGCGSCDSEQKCHQQ